jgi:hypothetical protein
MNGRMFLHSANTLLLRTASWTCQRQLPMSDGLLAGYGEQSARNVVVVVVVDRQLNAMADKAVLPCVRVLVRL